MAFYKGLMKVLAIVQQKGGVGKTTITRTIAEYFARYRALRVLLIDFDPQCNLSRRYLKMRNIDDEVVPPVHPDFYDPEIEKEEEWDGTSSSADFFSGRELYVYSTEIPGLDIVPAHDMKLKEVLNREEPHYREKRPTILHEFFTRYNVHEAYDLIIIDTPPNQLTSTEAALKAATHTIIPVQPEQQCVENLHQMISMWRKENKSRHIEDVMEMVGILINNADLRRTLHAGSIAHMKNDEILSDFLIPTIAKNRTSIAEADHPMSKHNSVWELAPRNAARLEAEAYCRYIEQAMYGDVTTDRKAV